MSDASNGVVGGAADENDDDDRTEHPDPVGRRSDLTQDEAESEAVGG